MNLVAPLKYSLQIHFETLSSIVIEKYFKVSLYVTLSSSNVPNNKALITENPSNSSSVVTGIASVSEEISIVSCGISICFSTALLASKAPSNLVLTISFRNSFIDLFIVSVNLSFTFCVFIPS